MKNDNYIPDKYLICPDCDGRVTSVGDHYICKNCSREFHIKNNVHLFLPSNLEKTKVSEDEALRLAEKYTLYDILDKKIGSIRAFKNHILNNYEFSGKILELGCGTGYISSLIKNKNRSCEVYALDVSPNYLIFAQKISEILFNSKIDYFIAGDAEKIPFKNEHFDFVIASAMMHHLPHPDLAFKEIVRVLKNDGMFIGIAEPIIHPISFKIISNFYPHIRNAAGKFKEREKRLGVTDRIFTYNEFMDYLDENFGHYSLSFSKMDKFEDIPFISLISYKTKQLSAVKNLLEKLFPVFDVNVSAKKHKKGT